MTVLWQTLCVRDGTLSSLLQSWVQLALVFPQEIPNETFKIPFISPLGSQEVSDYTFTTYLLTTVINISSGINHRIQETN